MAKFTALEMPWLALLAFHRFLFTHQVVLYYSYGFFTFVDKFGIFKKGYIYCSVAPYGDRCQPGSYWLLHNE